MDQAEIIRRANIDAAHKTALEAAAIARKPQPTAPLRRLPGGISRYLKAISMTVGSYYAGNIAGVFTVVGILGLELHNYDNLFGVAIAIVQGCMGVGVFAALLEYFPTDKLLRLWTAAVMAWGFAGLTLGSAVLRIWVLGMPGFSWWIEGVAAIGGIAPWCLVLLMLGQRRCSAAFTSPARG